MLQGDFNLSKYVFYCLDCESSGLDPVKNDIIELSIYKMADDTQKTWCIKPINFDSIEPAALRINGHKLEDLKGETKFGRDTYLDPNKAIVEIENWLAEDNVPASNRCMVGQNVNFDKSMMEQLWLKCNASDSFPFGRRFMDTMVMALMIDCVENNFSESYSLSSLTKKYGVKNDRAHSAAADTKATKEVFIKQIEYLRNKMNIK
jgi:DNA polymerase III alpha subunit (gram-positive type)